MYFALIFCFSLMDKISDMAITQSKVSLSSLKVTLKLCLISTSIIDIMCLTQNTKSALSLVLQFYNCFKCVTLNPQAYLIINLKHFSCKLKTWSTLYSKNRYNKKVIAPSPSYRIIQSCLLNQEITISVLELRVLSIFDDFLVQFYSSLLKRLHRILKLKGILIANYC